LTDTSRFVEASLYYSELKRQYFCLNLKLDDLISLLYIGTCDMVQRSILHSCFALDA